MFGRKPKETIDESEQVSVTVMPTEFYAGASPVIQFTTAPQKASPRPALVAPAVRSVAPPRNQPAKPTPTNKAPAGLLSNRTFLLTGTLGLFVLFVAGASWYYYAQYTKTTPPVVSSPPPPITINEPPPVIEVPVVVVTSTPTTTTESTEPLILNGGALQFPSTQLGLSLDSDRDGMTDMEEELYRSDAQAPDTDNDGFQDGLEVINLYSAVDAAPRTLLQSALVTEFVNPVSRYRMYYPTSWAQGHVTADYSDMLFSTLTGERVEVRDIASTSTTFADWFERWAPGERLSDLKPFTTRFGFKAYTRSDNLVFYYPTGAHVYVVVYGPGSAQTINYAMTVRMMAASFIPPDTIPVMTALQNETADTGSRPPGTATTTTQTNTIPQGVVTSTPKL